jgi:ectoine hydroxylase-related dioxygenase (phytanoyl-CoA dioxygenase family)
MFSGDQERHFRLFGYACSPGTFNDREIGEITAAFDDVLAESLDGKPFTGTKRQLVTGFVERRPRLSALVADDRIYQPVEQLVNGTPLWIESDGNLYVGDTNWHPDARPNFPLWIKVALYLDPVDEQTGGLRVIPGSHLTPFSAALDAASLRGPEGGAKIGLSPDRIPSVALASRPGDVIFFDQRTWHASYGGRTGRRMFTMNFASPIATKEERDLVLEIYKMNLGWSPSGRVYSDSFLNSESPRIQAITAGVKELGLK